MKKTLISFIVVSLMIVACGNNTQVKDNTIDNSESSVEAVSTDNLVSDDAEWISASNKNMNYEVPATWDSQVNDSMVYYYPFGKDDKPTRVVFYTNYQYVDNIEFANSKASEEELYTMMSAVKNGIKESSNADNFKDTDDTFGGRPAFWTEYHGKINDRMFTTHSYTALLSDRELVSIMYAVADGTEDIYNTYFKRMVESLTPNSSSEGGFEKAEYDRFNSLASENGLGGTKVYIDGTISEVIFDETNIMGLIVKQADDNEWIISIGQEPRFSYDKLNAMIGTSVRVFGVYPGLSLEFKKPMLLMYTEEKCRIEASSDKTYYFEDFLADKNELITWCDEQEEIEIAVSAIEDSSNKESYRKSTGRISNIYDNLQQIYLYQFIDSEYVGHTLSVKKTYFDDKFELSKLREDEPVTAYYYVSDDGTPYIIDIVENDTVTFTFDDLEQAYKDSCKEYTYKEIARNPDKVKNERAKLKGKVVQVLESGNTVELRVNITPKGYGYYDDTVYVYYYRMDETEDRILEDDIVTVYGRLNGLKTYTSVLKSEITLPEIVAEYIDISQ